MNSIPSNDIDSKLLLLPTEGLEEYLFWSEKFLTLKRAYMERIQLLKQLQIINPDHNYYIDLALIFGKAFINRMEWKIIRRTILAS